MSNLIYRGPLKPDAPEYKEDWTVDIGGLWTPERIKAWEKAEKKRPKAKKKNGGAGGS